MDAACEVNEKGTRAKNDGNGVVEEGSSPPLDLDPKEVNEADEKNLTLCRGGGLARPRTNRHPQEFGTRSFVYGTDSKYLRRNIILTGMNS